MHFAALWLPATLMMLLTGVQGFATEEVKELKLGFGSVAVNVPSGATVDFEPGFEAETQRVVGRKRRKSRSNVVNNASKNGSIFYNQALAEAEGSTPDVPKVIALLERAIEVGDSNAMYALATWYLNGQEPYVSIDYASAFHY